MASSNKTDKLQLPQWQLSDKPEMSDFNDAFNKVEDFKDEFDSHKADFATLNNNIKNKINMDAGILSSGGAIFSLQANNTYLFVTQHGNITLSAALIIYKGTISNAFNVHEIHKGSSITYEAIDFSTIKITSPSNTNYALIKLTDNPSV